MRGASVVVVGGLIALVVVLAVASAAGFALRQRQGRFRSSPPDGTPVDVPSSADGTPVDVPSSAGTRPVPPPGALSAADLGAPLGPRVTLVQFSTEVCAYCGPTRQLLAAVAAERDGVAFVEVDAAARMDLTRRLRVLSTPTVLVLDAAGAISSRASGPVRRAALLEAVGQALDPGSGAS